MKNIKVLAAVLLAVFLAFGPAIAQTDPEQSKAKTTVKKGAKKTGNTAKQGGEAAKQGGQAVGKGAKKAGKGAVKGTKKAGKTVKKGAEKGVEKTKDVVD